MEKSKRVMRMIVLYVFLFVYISPMLLCNVVNGENVGKSDQEKPSISERFKQIARELGKSSEDSWGKFKSYVYQVQEKLVPPSLNFRSKDGLSTSDDSTTTTTKMTEAVGKSLEKSESMLEVTADTMSKMVGDAVQKTKDKVQDTITVEDEADDDKKDEL